jgi:nitroreductase
LLILFYQLFKKIMETIKTLLTRRSISQLTVPIPSKKQMKLVYQAALRAPDHSWLRPWRFIEITGNGRKKLAQIFIDTSKKESEIDQEREVKISSLPFRAPMIIIIIAKIVDKSNVPRIEQIQSTAASVQNILLALHDMGFGAYWRTGKYITENNKYIANELSLSSQSEVLGYLYIGTPSMEAKEIPLLKNEDFVTYWD